ncbi:MAG: hypothetical protein ABIA97_02875 [Candidatus Omnitrophota bacterium]
MLNTFRKLLNKYPRSFAVFFGIILCIIFLFVMELSFYFLNKTSPDIKTIGPKPYYRIDKFGVYSALPGEQRFTKVNNKSNEVIWEAIYSIDEFGKRKTPVDNAEGRDKFLLFFGGSFTFGEGLGNNQTLPYEVGQRSQKYMPYNFGEIGAGPFDVLAKIESIDFKKQIKEKTGIMIYVLPIDVHVDRVVGSIDVSRWNDRFAYYRKDKSGSLTRSGTFYENRPFLTRLILKSQVLKYFNVKHIFPIRENDIKFTASVINTFFKIFKDKYSDAKVCLLIYPRGKYKNLLLKYINKDSIIILDYFELFDPSDPKFRISEYDKHPTYLANKILAESIVKDLDLE